MQCESETNIQQQPTLGTIACQSQCYNGLIITPSSNATV